MTLRPLLHADWLDVGFVHFAVPPSALQAHVPFPLDLREGRAWVSLLLFTQHRLRLHGERWRRWLTAPLATHSFCNLRTYVRCDGRTGIFFLREWISNRFARFLGPLTFGLPYRLAGLGFQRDGTDFDATVDDGRRRLDLRLHAPACDFGRPAAPDSRAGFLCKRYLAFTVRRGRRLVFAVDHLPWPLVPAKAAIVDDALLRPFPWFRPAEHACAAWSPGVTDVALSAPVPVGKAASGRMRRRKNRTLLVDAPRSP